MQAGTKRNSGHFVLSFFLPIGILGSVFALHGAYPAGGMQILVFDFWFQYYPFFSSLWHKLRDGTLSTWSWTAGAGHDYIALFAYYLASPLNLLALLFPHEWLREALTVMLLLKIGCAGLFMAIFLKSTFRKNNPAIIIFSPLYALCAFTLGYYWNIMWFDSIALMPLVMMGFSALMNEGKYKLYIFSLFLAVLFNFYIGFLICVFIVMAFLRTCVIKKYRLAELLRKLGLVAGVSVLAVGLTSALLLPAYVSLQGTYSDPIKLAYSISFYHNFFDIIGNFIAFSPPTSLPGTLPNLYCGMISVLLTGVYFASPKFSLREKLVTGAVLVFYLLSCNLIILDYVMHGFRFTNGMYSRFSFIISFILVVIAYRAYLSIDTVKKRDLLAMGLSAAMILTASVFGSQEKKYIAGSAAMCAFYLVIFIFIKIVKKNKIRFTLRIVLFISVIAELSVSSWIAIADVKLSIREGYPDRYSEIQSLLDQRSASDNDFYRTEIMPYFTLNDSSLYNYNGISFFSSTLGDSISGFVQGIGIIGGGTANNGIVYNLTTPLANAFLAMRYFIAGGIPPDAGIYWEVAGSAGDILLMENLYHLPLGFMTRNEIAGYAHNVTNSFISQNDLFRRATGLKSDLFMATNYTDKAETSTLHCLIMHDGTLYADFTYYDFEMENDRISIYRNGSFYREIYVLANMPCVTIIGNFTQNDVVSFKSERGTLINVGLLNAEVFRHGYVLLAAEPLNLTHFSGTRVSGTVTALADGILYTSIPGNNWNVRVDGKKSRLLLIDKTMAAVRISKGTHNVEFRYNNKSFTIGIIISLLSLAALTILICFPRKRNR